MFELALNEIDTLYEDEEVGQIEELEETGESAEL